MSREADLRVIEELRNILKHKLYNRLEYGILPELQNMPTLEDYSDQDKTIWKAGTYLVDIYPTVENEWAHDFIMKAFDIAVRENMTMGYYHGEYGGNFYDEFKKYTCVDEYFKLGHYSGVGCYDISRFLDSYRKTKIELAKQGKTMQKPETFKEFPELKDYADGIFRDSKGNIAARIQDDGSVKFEQSFIDSLSKQEKREMLEETRSRDFAVALLRGGVNDVDFSKIKAPLTELDKAKFKDIKIQELQEKLADIKNKLGEKKQELADKEQQLTDKEKVMVSERSTSVNAAEDIKNLTDEQKRDNFAAKKKLMTEHPIMLEPCLNSMCESYVFTKDEAIKKEMLGELYAVRKGGKTDAEKRDMAKTFKRVLDKNPALKKDENLVALSKIDTVFSKPTNKVKAQTTRS